MRDELARLRGEVQALREMQELRPTTEMDLPAEVPEQAGGDPAGAGGHLIDAKDAGRLLDVPPTWLLAQARLGRIPHHRLGHYVRFSAADMQAWLADNRIEPA